MRKKTMSGYSGSGVYGAVLWKKDSRWLMRECVVVLDGVMLCFFEG